MINEAEDLKVRMEFLEKQLAEATKDSQSNAHASKCLHDMMEAGVIK